MQRAASCDPALRSCFACQPAAIAHQAWCVRRGWWHTRAGGPPRSPHTSAHSSMALPCTITPRSSLLPAVSSALVSSGPSFGSATVCCPRPPLPPAPAGCRAPRAAANPSHAALPGAEETPQLKTPPPAPPAPWPRPASNRMRYTSRGRSGVAPSRSASAARRVSSGSSGSVRSASSWSRSWARYCGRGVARCGKWGRCGQDGVCSRAVCGACGAAALQREPHAGRRPPVCQARPPQRGAWRPGMRQRVRACRAHLAKAPHARGHALALALFMRCHSGLRMAG